MAAALHPTTCAQRQAASASEESNTGQEQGWEVEEETSCRIAMDGGALGVSDATDGVKEEVAELWLHSEPEYGLVDEEATTDRPSGATSAPALRGVKRRKIKAGANRPQTRANRCSVFGFGCILHTDHHGPHSCEAPTGKRARLAPERYDAAAALRPAPSSVRTAEATPATAMAPVYSAHSEMLPPGWTCEVHQRTAGGTWKTYHAAEGKTSARSRSQAWAMHSGELQKAGEGEEEEVGEEEESEEEEEGEEEKGGSGGGGEEEEEGETP